MKHFQEERSQERIFFLPIKNEGKTKGERNPLEESQVTLRLTDADGVVVQEENGLGEGDGAWSYTSDDLSSNGEYVFTIENESGSMDFDVIIDVKY